MCDVESYIYMPMLEELDYIPTRRYAFGEEILRAPRGDRRPVRPGGRRPVPHRRHPGRVARGRGPVADPHRPRRRGQLPLVRAGRRDPQPHEAARHPGHGGLRRALVPHGAVGLRVHRRRAARAARPAWRTRSSPSSAPGRRGIQCVPPLAESAKHVYVFQRTPSAIGERGNRPTEPDFAAAASSRAGSGHAWTTSRPSCWAGPSRSTRSTTGGRTTTPPSSTRRVQEGMTTAEYHAQRRGARLRDHGGAPATGSRSWWPTRPRPRSSSRTTATSASGRASTTSTCRPSTTPTSP